MTTNVQIHVSPEIPTVSKARINSSDTLHDLFHKLSPELHKISINLMTSRSSMQKALRRLQAYNNELRLNREIASEFTRRTLSKNAVNNARSSSLLTGSSIKNELNQTYNTEAGKSKIKCYNCGELGHLSTDCLKPASAATARRNASRALAQIEELGNDNTEKMEETTESFHSENEQS